MIFDLYQVDAFSNRIFEGNPAAVVPLGKEWLPDSLMQQVAMENQLSETAFFTQNGDKLSIRWFTPETEVDLCGHATIATAYVFKHCLSNNVKQLTFESNSGELGVSFEDDWIYLDFPKAQLKEWQTDSMVTDSLGVTPQACFKSKDDWMLIFETEDEVQNLQPDFELMKTIECRGLICTSVSNSSNFDFVSRFFAPRVGINEDPVTGSAHTKLIPYWSKKLNKKELIGKQISKRGGIIRCELKDMRVSIGGQAALFLKGEIIL